MVVVVVDGGGVVGGCTTGCCPPSKVELVWTEPASPCHRGSNCIHGRAAAALGGGPPAQGVAAYQPPQGGNIWGHSICELWWGQAGQNALSLSISGHYPTHPSNHAATATALRPPSPTTHAFTPPAHATHPPTHPPPQTKHRKGDRSARRSPLFVVLSMKPAALLLLLSAATTQCITSALPSSSSSSSSSTAAARTYIPSKRRKRGREERVGCVPRSVAHCPFLSDSSLHNPRTPPTHTSHVPPPLGAARLYQAGTVALAGGCSAPHGFWYVYCGWVGEWFWWMEWMQLGASSHTETHKTAPCTTATPLCHGAGALKETNRRAHKEQTGTGRQGGLH